MDAERPLPDDVPTLQAMVRDLREQLRTQAQHFEALIADLRAEWHFRSVFRRWVRTLSRDTGGYLE